jgi:hypothetical protein
MWVRGGRNSVLEVFDCPDPSVATPVRASTTTPQQALALLNSDLVLRMAERFVERLAQAAAPRAGDQIRLAYELALGRPPTALEVESLSPIIDRHGLTVFARALFNCHEFIYVH